MMLSGNYVINANITYNFTVLFYCHSKNIRVKFKK